MRNDEEIKTIKQELLEKYNIKTDRDLIQQLGIQDEDKSKLFAWIRYPCAFSYREGFDNGQDEIKEQLQTTLSKKKLTKKDKENLQTILEGIYIRDTFMASDDSETRERKKIEIQEFLKDIK